MTSVVNLTKVQQETLNKLNGKDYDGLKIGNVTRLLKKILKNKDLASEVLPKVADYEMATQGKVNISQVQSDLIKRIKNPDERAMIKNVLGQTDNREKMIDTETIATKDDKPKFDTDQSLEDLLDSLTADKPKEPRKSDDSGMAKARQPQMKAMATSMAGMGFAPGESIFGGRTLTKAEKIQQKKDLKELRRKDQASTRNIMKKRFADFKEKFQERFGRKMVEEDEDIIIDYMEGQGYKPEDFMMPEDIETIKRKGNDDIKKKVKPPKYIEEIIGGDDDWRYDESKHDDDDVDVDVAVKQQEEGRTYWERLPDDYSVGKGKGKGKGAKPSGAYEPYSGKSYRLSESDFKNKKPATMRDFMIRNGRKNKKVTKEDLDAYEKYMDNAKKSIKGLEEEYNKLQEDIKRNRKAVEDGLKPIGTRFTDKNDPFHIMRSMGYEFESDLDRESMGKITGGFFRGIGDVARVIPGLGEPIAKGLDVIGDIMEKATDWMSWNQEKAQYEWSQTTLDEIKAFDRDRKIKEEFERTHPGEAFIGISTEDRGDKYYQPLWKYTDYLPTEVDKFGVKTLNSGLQAKYLKPLQDYASLYQNAPPEFVDSVTPEQKQFLDALSKTVRQIQLGKLNITHKQYRDLLQSMVYEFPREQQQTDYMQKVNKRLADQVRDVYEYGKGMSIGTVPGGVTQFGDKIINDIEQAIDEQTRVETEPETTAEVDVEEEKDDEPDMPEEPQPEPPKEEPKEEPEPEPETEPKKEPEVKETAFEADFGHEPKYRPRGVWGGDDLTFELTEDTKQKRNLVLESSTLNEGIDRTNPLYKRQQIQYDIRYRNTFPMPRVDTYTPIISQEFIRDNRPIWNAQHVPTMRSMENSMRNPYDFGQYQNWEPKYDYTTTRGTTINNTNYFPSIADQMTHGEPMEIQPMTSYQQMIANQRWIRR